MDVFSQLTKSVHEIVQSYEPWTYFTLNSPLTHEQISEIRTAVINNAHIDVQGARSGYGNAREFITRENCHKYPNLTQMIRELQTPEMARRFASLVGDPSGFKDAFVRLEVLHDRQSFWLEPHCDIPEKLISSLYFINETDEDAELGTDLYDTELNHMGVLPFLHNVGYMFAGPGKWHGVRQGKTIKVERRGIQVNYVTFQTDWPVFLSSN